jgi:hypothetical protein
MTPTLSSPSGQISLASPILLIVRSINHSVEMKGPWTSEIL